MSDHGRSRGRQSLYRWYYVLVAKLIGGPVYTLLYFHRAEELSNVPRSGPVILAPNHLSYLDPPAVAYRVRRRVHFLAWSALFGGRLANHVLRRLGAIPIDVDGRDPSAYRAAVELLRAGELVCIFPEGGRGAGKGEEPLKPGFARLALHTGALVVPVVVEGTARAWSRFMRWPRVMVPIRVRYLAPIAPTRREGESRKAAEERLIEAVREAWRG